MAIITMLHAPKVQYALTNWYKNSLKKTAKKMQEGMFRNNTTGRIERCSGLVVLASGDICPVFKGSVCSLIPMHYNYQNSYVSQLTGPVAGTIDCRTSNIGFAVNAYNEDLLNMSDSVGIIALGRNIIVAYQSLREDWE